MFTKSNLIRNGVPSLVAFVILYLCDSMCFLLFSATDSIIVNLLIWLAIDAAMLLSIFYELDGHFSSLALLIIG